MSFLGKNLTRTEQKGQLCDARGASWISPLLTTLDSPPVLKKPQVELSGNFVSSVTS